MRYLSYDPATGLIDEVVSATDMTDFNHRQAAGQHLLVVDPDVLVDPRQHRVAGGALTARSPDIQEVKQRANAELIRTSMNLPTDRRAQWLTYCDALRSALAQTSATAALSKISNNPNGQDNYADLRSRF